MMAMESTINSLNKVSKYIKKTEKVIDNFEKSLEKLNKKYKLVSKQLNKPVKLVFNNKDINEGIKVTNKLIKLYKKLDKTVAQTQITKVPKALNISQPKKTKDSPTQNSSKAVEDGEGKAVSLSTKIKNAANSIPEKFDLAQTKALEIQIKLMNAVDNIPSAFDQAYTKVLAMEIKLSSAIDNFPAKFNEAKEKLSKSIPKIFTNAKSDAGSMAEKISSAFKSIPSKLGQAKNKVSEMTGNFSKKIKSIPSALGKVKNTFTSKIQSGVSLIQNGFQKAKDIWDATGAKGVELNSAESAVKGMAGGQSEQVMGTIDNFNQQSLFNRKDALMAGESFMPMIAGSENMSESMGSLLDMTERLAMSNKEMDFGKAAEAVKSAFGSGDFSALSESFNIPESDIEQFKLQPYVESGDVQGFAQQFNQMLAGRGIGDTYIDEMKNSTQGNLTKVKSNWDDIIGGMQQKLAEGLQPVIEKINEMLQSPETQTIIENVGLLIQTISEYIIQLITFLQPLFGIVNQVLTFVIENANVIIPILLFLVTVIGAIVVVQKILNLVMMANPIVLIITAVILLIGIFVLLIATLEPVREKFISVGQAIIGFVGNVINTFLEALAGLVRGIFTFAQKAINGFLNIFVNPFIDGINMVIDALNFITGSKFEKLDHLSVDFQDKANEISDAILDKKVNVEGAQEAFGNFVEGGAKAVGNMGDKFNIQESATQSNENNDFSKNIQNNTNIYSLKNAPTNNQMGNNMNTQSNMQSYNSPMAKDDVSVNNEDMQLMKELAEREAINKVVNVNPTVDVGDITVNKDADADRLLGQITEKLIEEVTNSAKGVYC